MASKSREIIKLKCSEGDSKYVYWTIKNKKKTTQRLELRKYCPVQRKHVLFKEAK